MKKFNLRNQAVEGAIKIKACKWWLLMELSGKSVNQMFVQEKFYGRRNIYDRRNEAKPAQWAMLEVTLVLDDHNKICYHNLMNMACSKQMCAWMCH